MKIVDIVKNDIEKNAIIGVESFINEELYSNYKNRGKKGFKELKKLFEDSIMLCVEHGYAKQVIIDEGPVAFILGFNFNKIKQNKEIFKYFFTSKEHDQNEKLQNLYKSIDKICARNYEYMYLLSIAVKKEYRGKKIATKLVEDFIYRNQYTPIITDISNDAMIKICKNYGFSVEEKKISGCNIAVKNIVCMENEWDKEKIYLALPHNSEYAKDYPLYKTVKLENVDYLENCPVFINKFKNGCEADIYEIDSEVLLSYQASINMNKCIENVISIDGFNVVYYISQNDKIESEGTGLKDMLLKVKNSREPFVFDVCTSIPLSYNSLSKVRNCQSQNGFYNNRLVSTLNFRSEYESGIPIVSEYSRGYKERVERINLGFLTIQLIEETIITFNGSSQQKKIGEKFDVSVILSLDTNSNIAVLHLQTISFSNELSQYLDCFSRNQIEVLTDNGRCNLYEYISREFGLIKHGTPKHFVTSFKNRDEINNDWLSSILFCETYYQADELLGKVIDSKIVDMVNKNHGVSQYNYADVFMSSNMVFQTSKNLFNSVDQRLISESITLFYIELILFEEAAISYADFKTREFLSKINKCSSTNVLKVYARNLNEYASTIDFWNVKMNYPSSQASVDKLREYFKINDLDIEYERDAKIFHKIYETKSNYADRVESSILTAVGFMFTIMSIIDSIWNISGYYKFGLASVFVVIMLIFKRKFLQRDNNNRKDI